MKRVSNWVEYAVCSHPPPHFLPPHFPINHRSHTPTPPLHRHPPSTSPPQIVSEEDFELRVNLLTKLYMVCEQLRQLTNWDMLVAVHGGMSSSSSTVLRRTHYAVENSDIGPLVVELNELLAHQGRTKLLQDFMLQNPDPPQPRFPSIVVCLKQLELVEEQPAELDGHINYFRMALEHNLIQFLLQAKGMHLPFAPIPKLLAVFSRFRVKDQEELRMLSYNCEPLG